MCTSALNLNGEVFRENGGHCAPNDICFIFREPVKRARVAHGATGNVSIRWPRWGRDVGRVFNSVQFRRTNEVLSDRVLGPISPSAHRSANSIYICTSAQGIWYTLHSDDLSTEQSMIILIRQSLPISEAVESPFGYRVHKGVLSCAPMTSRADKQYRYLTDTLLPHI